MTSMPCRIPPQSIEAEMAVLGSMMLGDASAVEQAIELLRPEDFYRDTHAHLFEAMRTMAQKSEPVDTIPLKNELERRGILEKIGGIAYLMQLADLQYTTAHIGTYAKIVKNKALLRFLIEECSKIAADAYANPEDTDALLETAERSLFTLRDSGSRLEETGEMLNPLLEKALEALDYQHHHPGQLMGVSTGFDMLDYYLSGLNPGDLILLAGRPSMGKSAIASQLATNIIRDGESSVVFFSLEMSRGQIAQRILCTEARVNAQHIRAGTAAAGVFTNAEWERLHNTTSQLWGGRALVDDRPNVTVGYMRSVCRRHKARYGLDAVFVDYIGLMGSGSDKIENRTVEIDRIAEGLKNLAREFKVPVVALCQLNRGVEKREDKRPLLSDLRDSGGLEQHADVVLMCFRENYYKPKEERADPTTMEIAEIIIAKQRMGPTTTVKLGFTPAYTRFDNLTSDPHIDANGPF